MFHSVMTWVKNSHGTVEEVRPEPTEGLESTSEGEEDGAGDVEGDDTGKCVRKEYGEREVHLPDLLQYVRLPLLSAKFLTDVVDEEVL